MVEPETSPEHTQAKPRAKLLQVIKSIKPDGPAQALKVSGREAPMAAAFDQPVVTSSCFIG
jgi:hypothetical protein